MTDRNSMKNFLLIIDPQRDFHGGGSLSIPGMMNLCASSNLKHYLKSKLTILLTCSSLYHSIDHFPLKLFDHEDQVIHRLESVAADCT